MLQVVLAYMVTSSKINLEKKTNLVLTARPIWTWAYLHGKPQRQVLLRQGLYLSIMWDKISHKDLHREKNYFCSLISAFVNHFMESTVELQWLELRWLELVGTVGESSTHPCVRAIPSLAIFKWVHVYFMSSRTSHFLWTKVAKRTWHQPFAR